MYIFEQLFSATGYQYAIAVLAMFIFILFYFILSTERK
jgi:hypothetical protein